MANPTNYETVDAVHTPTATHAEAAKPAARFDLMQGQLRGGASEDKSGQGPAHELFKDRCPLNGVELPDVGKDFGVSVSAHINPKDGFALHVYDSTQAADELTQYQIMKGGYDGRKKVLTGISRAHVPQLDNPFVTLDMYLHNESIERLLGPLPTTLREGTLDKWREDGWRNEAQRIIKDANAYNPIHNELCRIKRTFVARELTEEEAHWQTKNPDQHLFHEEEVIEVHATKIATLPKNRYLTNMLTLLGQIRTALGVKG
ncbi:MAG: hypothetical protein EB059_09635 [Alphaproteobacteria bacterium]|nr:hypothetical protein [Alphaproteobacteria bacterium]